MNGLLNRERVLHYIDIFIAAFAVDLVTNQQHLLGAHGLNALKSLAIAAAIAGAKAVLETYRKAAPASPYADLAAAIAKASANFKGGADLIPPASPGPPAAATPIEPPQS